MNHRYSSLVFTALFSAALLAPSAAAQDWHPVGTGTNTNGPNGVPTPFGDIYAGQRAQYIYLASELADAGLTAGDAIVRLRWVVTALNGSGVHENYTLRIGATSATSLSGFLPTPMGATTTPRDHQPVVGNNDFTLNSPFVWNGTSNLLVEVTHFSPTYGTYSQNASVAFTSTAPVPRSYSMLDDLMYNSGQTEPLDGETLNSTGLPNIVLGVATDCSPLSVMDLSICVGEAIPTGEGLTATGCTEGLGGLFTVTHVFPSDLPCAEGDYVLRASINLPPLPTGAVVQAGRLILTNVQAPDPVWMSDLFMLFTGSIDGEIQLMPNHESYSGTVPELIVPMTGPYQPGLAELHTLSLYETGYIGGARVEFDYLLPTPFWYDAPTGGNLVAYGQSTLDPVAEGLADGVTPGITTLYVDCGVTTTACTSTRAAVELAVLEVPEPAFTTGTSETLAGEAVHFTYTGSTALSYFWDFGDATSSIEMDPTHTWSLAGDYPVTLTVDNGACEGSTSSTVTVDVNTGLDALHGMDALRAYASAGTIVLEGSSADPVRVDVVDALGRTVFSRDGLHLSGRISLPVAELGTGIWFVRVISGDQQRTFRVPLVR